MKLIICLRNYEEIILQYPWKCPICIRPLEKDENVFKIRPDWKKWEKALQSNLADVEMLEELPDNLKCQLRGLSAFDGVSGGIFY